MLSYGVENDAKNMEENQEIGKEKRHSIRSVLLHVLGGLVFTYFIFLAIMHALLPFVPFLIFQGVYLVFAIPITFLLFVLLGVYIWVKFRLNRDMAMVGISFMWLLAPLLFKFLVNGFDEGFVSFYGYGIASYLGIWSGMTYVYVVVFMLLPYLIFFVVPFCFFIAREKLKRDGAVKM